MDAIVIGRHRHLLLQKECIVPLPRRMPTPLNSKGEHNYYILNYRFDNIFISFIMKGSLSAAQAISLVTGYIFPFLRLISI
jgi:hypothetical protein